MKATVQRIYRISGYLGEVFALVFLVVLSYAPPGSLADDSPGKSYEELFMGLKKPFDQRGESPRPRETPEGTVQALYEDEVFFNLRNSFPNTVIQYLSACFTSGLIQHFESCRKEIETWLAGNTDENLKLNLSEGPIFLSNYEGAGEFRVGEVKVDGDRAEVAVSFSYSEGGNTFRWTDVAILRFTGGVWLLDDILLNPEGRDSWTLRKRASIKS